MPKKYIKVFKVSIMTDTRNTRFILRKILEEATNKNEIVSWDFEEDKDEFFSQQ